MEEDPAARKERLKALKAAAQATGGAGSAASQQAPAPDPSSGAGTALRFRNYNVKDTKRIVHEQVAPAQPPKLEEPVVESKPEEADREELLANVAPKKANWDLKRDLQSRLDKLERRTQRAVVEIMREEEQAQLQADGGVQD